jgi:hypothetical protein
MLFLGRVFVSLTILRGMRKLLNWSWRRYRAPIYITENGVAEMNDPSIPLETSLKDEHRINYFKNYISETYNAIMDGVDVRGYFAWSMMDNFEWADGYSARFGIHFVDFKNQTRYQKSSAKWWQNELLAYNFPTFWNQLEIFIWIALIATMSLILFSVVVFFIVVALKGHVDSKKDFESLQ